MANSGPITYEEYQKTSFFPSLDGLRAIAVSLVFCVHFGGPIGAAVMGRFGVQVFFVLSGFLITTLLLRENEAHGHVDFRRFYIRRIFRIMPVFYLTLALVVWQGHHIDDWWPPLKQALPYYATFMSEVVQVNAPWKVTWSLGIEWKFYLVWPALAFMVARTARARWLIALVLVAALASVWWELIFQLRQYLYLMFGVFLAMTMETRRGFNLIKPLMTPFVALALFIAFIVFQITSGKIFTGVFLVKAEFLYSLAIVPLIPAIIGQGLPNKLLSSAPMVFIGRRSYSMYLIQPFASQAVQGMAPWHIEGVYNVIQVIIVGVIFSDILYRYVEKPMIAVGNRIAATVIQKRATTRLEATRSSNPL